MSTNLINSKTMNDIAILLYTQKDNSSNIISWIINHKIITLLIIIICYFIYKKYNAITNENFIYEYKNENINNKYQLIPDNSMDTPYIRPTMNPSYPISQQQNYVRYLPNEYPYEGLDGVLHDYSNKQLKNGSVLTDQGIQDINYTYTPIIQEQYKGPIYK